MSLENNNNKEWKRINRSSYFSLDYLLLFSYFPFSCLPSLSFILFLFPLFHSILYIYISTSFFFVLPVPCPSPIFLNLSSITFSFFFYPHHSFLIFLSFPYISHSHYYFFISRPTFPYSPFLFLLLLSFHFFVSHSSPLSSSIPLKNSEIHSQTSVDIHKIWLVCFENGK